MPVKPPSHKPARPATKRHVVESVHESRVRKDNTNATGYGYKWRKASQAYLKANPTCAICESKGRVRLATEVHHTVAHRGDMAIFWDRATWQSVCKPCHSVETAKGR